MIGALSSVYRLPSQQELSSGSAKGALLPHRSSATGRQLKGVAPPIKGLDVGVPVHTCCVGAGCGGCGGCGGCAGHYLPHLIARP